MKIFFLLLALSLPAWLPAQKDSAKSKPDFSKIELADIKWTRAEGGSFWFYYKPTQYFFNDKEFQLRTLENGDVLVFLFEPGIYMLLPDFVHVKINEEKTAEPVTARSAVFIKRGAGANFCIIDRGQVVQNLERAGITAARQYIFRSRLSDKLYWIDESDFLSAPVSKPVGILSE